jgi:hypothetical protein
VGAFQLRASSLLIYQSVMRGAVGEAFLAALAATQKYQVGALHVQFVLNTGCRRRCFQAPAAVRTRRVLAAAHVASRSLVSQAGPLNAAIEGAMGLAAWTAHMRPGGSQAARHPQPSPGPFRPALGVFIPPSRNAPPSCSRPPLDSQPIARS